MTTNTLALNLASAIIAHPSTSHAARVLAQELITAIAAGGIADHATVRALSSIIDRDNRAATIH